MTAADGLAALKPTSHAAWEPRRVLTLAAARRRSVFVRTLRLGLLAIVLAWVVTIGLQLILGGSGESDARDEPVSADVRMTNPRFTGRDDNSTPFTVTADIAIRRLTENGDELTELEHPRLEYDLLAAEVDAREVVAESGIFDPARRILDLFTDVSFSTRGGYTFDTEQARIFLREERVTGREPVTGSGPMGEISANGYEIRDGGALVIFEGDVVARIYQTPRESPAGDDAPTEE